MDAGEGSLSSRNLAREPAQSGESVPFLARTGAPRRRVIHR